MSSNCMDVCHPVPLATCVPSSFWIVYVADVMAPGDWNTMVCALMTMAVHMRVYVSCELTVAVLEPSPV